MPKLQDDKNLMSYHTNGNNGGNTGSLPSRVSYNDWARMQKEQSYDNPAYQQFPAGQVVSSGQVVSATTFKVEH